MHTDTAFRLLTALAGAVGVTLLIASFPMNPGPPPGSSLPQILDYGRQHESTIVLAGWMQGMGSLLNVLFALGLIQLAGASRKLSGWLTLLSGTGILVASLAECGLYFAAVEAGRGGDGTALMTTLTLIKGVQHVYLIVPALLLPVGWALIQSRVLPRVFGCSGLAIGVALQVLGLAGILYPLQAVVDTLLIVQGMWFLVASVALAALALKSDAPALHGAVLMVQP